MPITFSVVLPIYHQSKQIETLVATYGSGLKKLKESFEIILVINGGDTASYVIAQKLTKKNPFLKVLYLEEAGWGNAIIAGMEKAEGTFICYTNSARTRISDLITILTYAKSNPSVVIKATRILHLNFLRKLGSTLYNIECRLLLHTPVWDVNGTPKVMPSHVARKIGLTSKGDLIDAELIAKCVWNNIPILEVPILFPPRFGGNSTTRIFSALKMYTGVFKIKDMLKRPTALRKK